MIEASPIGEFALLRDGGRVLIRPVVPADLPGIQALFERLSDDARRDGIARFLAIVLATNHPMLRMLEGLGFRLARHRAGGEVEADVALCPDAAYLAAADARRHVAATASLQPILRPGSIAVVGASRERGTIGHELFRNLLAGGFDGPVYPVNPKAHAVAGVRAYPSGTANATFAPTLPPAGRVAVASQSGALGIALLEQARRLGIGISSFVSMGNKADLSSNDLLECWEEDDATGVVVLYLESFGNGRRFARVARRVAARKPIVAVKGGRGQAGRRAAASHTAALAGSDVAVDALFRQAGVIRCDTLDELFDATALLANQPLPDGPRVGVITNAGGLGILCADACEANGLTLPQLAPETQAALRALLPAEASVGNPVDMLAAGSPASYGQALKLVLADPAVDAAIVLVIPPLVTQAADVAAALTAACEPRPAKPVLTCFVGIQGVPPALGRAAIPSYTFPEAAARALGHAARRAAWLRRPAGRVPSFADVDPAPARAVVEAALARAERPWLRPDEVATLLRAYGIPTPTSLIARSPDEAAAAAKRIGGPVAVKLVSEMVLHKTDVGGVHLNLRTPEAAAEAYRAIERGLAERGLAGAMDGALVQPMLSGGVECLVGVVTDPTFGPLIGFGLGGVLAEAIGDVAFRVHPLTDVDADDLIGSVKAHKLLTGYRGARPADLPALRELLLRVSRLVDDVPEIAELDTNPVVVRELGQGVLALDARIRLSRVP